MTAGPVPARPAEDPATAGRAAWRPGLLWIAVACLAGAAVLYVLALGVGAAQRMDEDLRYPQIVGDWRLRDDASDTFARVAATGFAAWGVLVAAIALAVGRGRRLVPVLGAFVLAAAGAWLASEVLGRLDPLGGEALRYTIEGDGTRLAAPGGFPSGHAAVTTGLAVATVLALPPRLRPAGVAVVVPVTAAVCTGIMALGWHYPSDILAGILLGIAAGAAVAASPLWPAEPSPGRRGILHAVVGADVALTLSAAAGAWGIAALPDESAGAFADAHPRFIAFCVIVPVVAAAGLSAVVLALRPGTAGEGRKRTVRV
ncbi:MAG: phosphatase PAP2 family protein [Thermoleophilia bacterium]|nr:phosphatase PAP2 family protein [Thermoleophilia bacterium]